MATPKTPAPFTPFPLDNPPLLLHPHPLHVLCRVLVRLRPCDIRTDVSVIAASPTTLIFSNLAEGPDASYEFDGVLGQVRPSFGKSPHFCFIGACVAEQPASPESRLGAVLSSRKGGSTGCGVRCCVGTTFTAEARHPAVGGAWAAVLELDTPNGTTGHRVIEGLQ